MFKHIGASSLCLSLDCSPLGLELMLKLRTLLTVFTLNLKDDAKGALHFRLVLVVFGQSQCTVSVGQSEQTVLVRRRGFVETNNVFERDRA